MDGLTAIAYVLSNASCFYIDPNNITIGGESCGATIGTAMPRSTYEIHADVNSTGSEPSVS